MFNESLYLMNPYMTKLKDNLLLSPDVNVEDVVYNLSMTGRILGCETGCHTSLSFYGQ